MFNNMLKHGYNCQMLLHSTIISIPKDARRVLSNPNNYRGISLFNSINKVFDFIVLGMCKHQLTASDM